jgi:hypothetical protein
MKTDKIEQNDILVSQWGVGRNMIHTDFYWVVARKEDVVTLVPLSKVTVSSNGSQKMVIPRIAEHGCVFTDFDKDLEFGPETQAIKRNITKEFETVVITTILGEPKVFARTWNGKPCEDYEKKTFEVHEL